MSQPDRSSAAPLRDGEYNDAAGAKGYIERPSSGSAEGRVTPSPSGEVAATGRREERDKFLLRRLLYEVLREVPTSGAGVYEHADRQALHRRVIEALGEEEPGEFVPSDYWLGRFSK